MSSSHSNSVGGANNNGLASIYEDIELKSDSNNNNTLGDNNSNNSHKSNNTNENGSRRRRSRLRDSVASAVAGVTTASRQLQGRLYSPEFAKKPGGIRLEDMIFGIKMAQLSVTDDSEERLKSLGPTSRETLAAAVRTKPINPINNNNHNMVEKEAFPAEKVANDDNNDSNISEKISLEETIKAEEKEAYKKPLSTLLREYFNLNMECWMDETGVKFGRPVDMQGFIASNITPITPNDPPPLPPVPTVQDDNYDILVLSYRFTVTKLDWMANFDMTSSKWDVVSAERMGHAGICSCLDCTCRFYIPRVHTGFYNNFVYSIPKIRKHIIEPLLKERKDLRNNNKVKPKKIYICGCSLGAALATLAFSFIVQELPLEDPTFPSHKIICVTAGSPRVGNRKFQKVINERMQLLRQLDRAVNCRIVYNNDLVPHLPFYVSDYRHLDTLVYITFDGDVIIDPWLKNSKHFKELVMMFRKKYWDGEKEPVASKVAKRFSHINSTVQRNAAAAQIALQCKLQDIAEGDEDSSIETGDDVDDNASEHHPVADNQSSHKADNNDTGKSETRDGKNKSNTQEKPDYELEWESCKGPVRDHMPYWYLLCLEQLKVRLDMQQGQ